MSNIINNNKSVHLVSLVVGRYQVGGWVVCWQSQGLVRLSQVVSLSVL